MKMKHSLTGGYPLAAPAFSDEQFMGPFSKAGAAASLRAYTSLSGGNT
jgi:hypothetical protein